MTTPSIAAMAFSAPKVAGLDDVTQGLLEELVRQWAAKMPRNIERLLYLEGKNRLKDLQIALPPTLLDVLEIVMGWPEKAVYTLANRIAWDGVTSDDGSGDPFGLRETFRRNRFKVELQQGVVESLAQSVSFVSTTPGRREAGEPDVLVMMHSALWATGLWSPAARALRAGLLVNDVDPLGQPKQLTILTPFEAIVCTKGATWYVEDVIAHRLGRVPLEALPFRPTLTRPFGRARIDRRVRNLTDRAMRAGARMEVHAEIFSAPKLLLLGAHEDAFKDASGKPVPLWTWYMGRFNTLSKDEDGDLPKLEKISAESPEPHIAMLRQLGADFSGATGVPLGSLGITTDNPSSAQAINEVREELIIEALVTHDVYDSALSRVYENIVMIRDNLDTPPPQMLGLSTKWRNPARPSVVSQSDAMVKQIAAIPELAETEVALEELGYTSEQIARIRADFRRSQGRSTLDSILATPTVGTEASGTPQAAQDANVLKAKFDALGVAVRTGVDPQDAAARLGLAGIKFTGAVPVALRMPETESRGLEDK